MLKKKKPIAIPVSYPERRKVRYRLMRIRNQNDDTDDGLKERIEAQFGKGMAWEGFTETWDVGQKNPYKVVRVNREGYI